jgi:hypothetical protein
MGNGSKQPVHLFIDTNVFLRFYAFANDDIEQLKKLVGLIKKGRLQLYATTQLHQEFYRNREKKLTDSIRDFERLALQQAIPRYMDDYAEAKAYREALAALQKAKNGLVVKAKHEAEHQMLAADSLFSDIMAVATVFKPTEDEFDRAHRRMLLGNPPGKTGSLGDQLNWEVLISRANKGTDLNLISFDGDYASPLNEARAHQFLIDEWKERKAGVLTWHRELRPFLTSRFPEIKLAIDIEKRIAIDQLKNSGSFQTTHSAITELAPYAAALTQAELDELIEAAKTNSQIQWIKGDPDVKEFYQSAIKPWFSKMDKARQKELDALFEISSTQGDS